MNKYILRTITGRDGSDYLAVVYNGEFSENSPSIIGLQENNIEVMSDRLSAENTSVFLGPLKTNTPYTLKIYEDGNVQQTSFSTSDDCSMIHLDAAVADNVTVALNAVAPLAAASTTFSAYRSASATSPLEVYSSLFQAIERARQAGTGAVVKMNGTDEVYRHGQTGRYYKYQFTASYGYTTNLTDVSNWLSGYLYTHVITSSNARFYGCNWLTAKGTPNEWAKEPNSGGYYYQFGYACTDNKVTKKILLSQSRLKPSQNANMPFNAYVFFTFQNSTISVDAGIYSGGGNGTWKLCISATLNTGYDGFYSGDTICNSTLNSSGEYVADADIQLTVSYTTGKLTLVAKNLTTGKTYTMDYSNSRISGTPCLISSVSYVPDLASNSPVTPDFRCGGYFRNVIQTESKVYTSGGTAYDFYSKSNKTQYSLRYNTDCCDLTSGSSRDIIDIFYDRAYRT